MNPCSFAGCVRISAARGLCKAHYWQHSKGKALTPIQRRDITPQQRMDRLTDKTGSCWIWRGSLRDTGYGQFRFRGSMTQAHRAAYVIAFGDIPDSIEVDHSCHNRSCVRPDHLHQSTRKQNMENRAGARAGSISGVRGVSPYRDGKRWVASVGHLGRSIYLGIFETIDDAARASKAKRLELHTNNILDRKSS